MAPGNYLVMPFFQQYMAMFFTSSSSGTSQLLALPDPHMRQRLAAILEQGIQQLHAPNADRPTVWAPDWFNSLQLTFDSLAALELLEEGPVFYIHTWFIDAAIAARCPVSRPVRLRHDRRIWQTEIITRPTYLAERDHCCLARSDPFASSD